MDIYSDKTLKPYATTIGVIGTTGSGKTETTSMFTTFEAEEIITRAVGKTNSTLKERRIIFSERYLQEIVIAVKKKEKIYPRNDFKQVIINAFTKVVKKYGKQASTDHEDIASDFTDYLNQEMNTVVNTKAILTFITSTDLDEYIQQLVRLFVENNDEIVLYYTLYHSAKNQLLEKEKKDNSAKLTAAIKIEVGKYLDNSLSSEKFLALWEVWEQVNLQLDKLFFHYFIKEQHSKDGYHFHRIDLNCVEESKEIINAFFTSNNLREGEQLSIEVFCEEIVLYAPLNQDVAQVLKQYGNRFLDRHGYITIAFLDTKGIFHSNHEVDILNEYENLDESHFNDLLYNHDYDALLFVCPLFGDANEEKFKNICAEVLAGFNRQIPIFVLQNKVDLFIDNESKKLNQSSRFYKSNMAPKVVLDIDQVIEKIDHSSRTMIEELERMQSIKRQGKNKIIPLVCYLRMDSRHEEEFLEKYNPLNAIKTMFSILNEHQQYLLSTNKLKVVLEQGYEDIQLCINSERLEETVSLILKSKNMEAKVYKPADLNVENNIGIRPHGSGLNAVRRKLRYGLGHNSNINENYFVNCKSFNFDLPGILRNLISKDLVESVLIEAVEFEGGRFEDSEKITDLKGFAVKYFDSYQFVAQILYYRAFLDAENKGYFDNKSLFKTFLQNSRPYSTGYHYEQTAALEKVLKDAIQKAVYLHVQYV